MSRPISLFFSWGDICPLRCCCVWLISLVLDRLCSFSSWGINIFPSIRETDKSHQFYSSGVKAVGMMHQLPPWSLGLSPLPQVAGPQLGGGGEEVCFCLLSANSSSTFMPLNNSRCSTIRCIHFELKKKKKRPALGLNKHVFIQGLKHFFYGSPAVPLIIFLSLECEWLFIRHNNNNKVEVGSLSWH